MRFIPTLIIVLLIPLFVGCGAQATPPAEIPPTATEASASMLTNPAQATEEAEAVEPATETGSETSGDEQQAEEESAASATATPTSTPQPNPTPTATESPTPVQPTATPVDEPETVELADASINVNVRSGPGTNYPVVDQMEPGEEADVTGRNDDESWWKINLPNDSGQGVVVGWIFAELVIFEGDREDVAVTEAPPPPPTATPAPETAAETEGGNENSAGEATQEENTEAEPTTPEELADSLRCGKDFCVTYQAMVPIWENGGCIGNHSIYVTVLEGPPPGKPLDGIVIGDTFNNIEVASGSKGPGTAEVTLWMNSMTLVAKRHIDGTPFTSEESFNFTSHDELIPAELLAANGYCDGNVEECRRRQNLNQVCRGHYSWRVTFHKFD